MRKGQERGQTQSRRDQSRDAGLGRTEVCVPVCWGGQHS